MKLFGACNWCAACRTGCLMAWIGLKSRAEFWNTNFPSDYFWLEAEMMSSSVLDIPKLLRRPLSIRIW